jgi:hypothetical protein
MRAVIDSLNGHFERIDSRQRAILNSTEEKNLFWTPAAVSDSMITLSVGGSILRSGAMVEQVFLGLTRRLWDDPFEWTLPEKLSTRAAITGYLDEVAQTRQSGFQFLESDADLARMLPAPETLKPIGDVLIEALVKASRHLGTAEAILKLHAS